MTISELLQSRPYPGRGVLAARTATRRRCLGYFLTGRSEASRERVLALLVGGDVAVRAKDSGGSPDDLRHYVAAARRDEVIVVGNGSQVLPLAQDLAQGTELLRAFSCFDHEPDQPIFTPRIWVTTRVEDDSACVFGYAVRSSRSSNDSDVVAWMPGTLTAGEGMLMSTYDGTATDVRTARQPVDFTTKASSPSELLRELWSALDPELRVAAITFDPAMFPSNVEIIGRD